MGDMADDFRAFKEYKRGVRNKVEPSRFDYAIKKIHNAGFLVDRVFDDDKKLEVEGYIDFWPYTGWWSGRGIGSGRGVNNLIKRLKDFKESA